MHLDTLDRSLWIALALTVVALPVTFFLNSPTSGDPSALIRGRAGEQLNIREAKAFMTQRRYEPVEAMIKAGQHQQALLKIEELSHSFPGDPHALILRGELLATMGAPSEAAASFAQGIRLDGGYVDRNSPLSHRETIQRLVETELPRLTNQSHASDPSSTAKLSNIRYLQSRLAGGCE